MSGPPIPGQDPWGVELNAYLAGLEAKITALEAGGGGGGVSDHGALTGLADNDHPQYALLNHTHAGGGGGSGGGEWFTGKQWYAMGTSLTIQGFYTQPLASLSGMILHNIGQSAQSLSQTPTGGSGAMWSAMISQTGADAEVITMETTNDWRLNATLGTIADAEDYQVSFYGALKGACKWILTNRPAARFFLITNYNDAMPEASSWPNFYKPNNLGKFQWEYNEAIRKVAQVYGVPVIDVAEGAGLNYFTMTYYSSDGLHMNTLGGQRFAEYAWSEMKSLDWGNSRPTAPGGIVTVAVTGVTIDQGSALAIAPAGTFQLTATIAPSNATNKGMTWSSSAPGVATVNGSGLVTGVTVGTSTVTVSTVDGAKTDTITITVAVAAVTGVDVTPATGSVLPSGTLQLTAAVLPSNAGNKAVTWSSSAPSKATVNSSGLVTGVAIGSANISALTQEGSFSDACIISVVATIPVTGVDVLPASAQVAVGSTVQLTANVLPANAGNKNVTWVSSDVNKATVTSTGLVLGVATGSCTITCTTQQGGFTDACVVSVPGSDWSLRKADTYTGWGLTGLTVNANNDPTYSIAWPYGALILNDITAGDNAVEFVVASDSGGAAWLVFGTDGAATTFGAIGAVGAGQATLVATPTSGGIGGTTGVGGYLTTNTATGDWVPGDKFRLARSGGNVTLWKWSGSTWTKHLEFPLDTVTGAVPGGAAATQSPGIGILVAPAGQAKVTDVWTGVYSPSTYVPLTGMSILPVSKTLSEGSTFFCTVDYTPDTATEKKINWVSSNPAVASVTAAGKIQALTAGTTTITGTTVDGNFTDTCVVTVPAAVSEWSLATQTTFRGIGLTGITSGGTDDPTYDTMTLAYACILINTPGHNAVEFAIKSGAKGGGFVLGSNNATDWISVGNVGTPLTAFNAKAAFTNGAYADGAPPGVTPTAAAAGWGTDVIYRIGRVGNRVKIVRVDPGNTLVTVWDADLPTNYVGHASKFATIDLGVLAYQAPETIYTLPINCKTGTWTPSS